ncbi:MAG: beta strand repeat-containing protein, partial [Isosphaeraceae bacterium]
VANLTLASGTLDGTGSITTSGLFDWTGGNIAGSVTDAGSMTISGGGAVYLSGSLSVAGTLDWADSTTVASYGSAAALAIAQGGVLDAQGDGAIRNVGYGGSITVTNDGTLEKTGGSGTTTIGFPFDDAGAVTVDSGLVSLTGGGASAAPFSVTAGVLSLDGGTFTLQSGAAESGAGALQVNGGELTLATDVDVANLTLASGTLDGTGSITTSGLFDWTGGVLGGAVTEAGPMTISGDSTVYLSGTLTVAGTLDWADSTTIASYSDSAALTVAAGGVLDAQGDAAIEGVGYGGSITVTNDGILEKTGGSGTTTIAFPFDDAGAVEETSGTLDIASTSNLSGGTLTGGTWIAGTNSTLNLNSTISTLAANVTLEGSGATVSGLSGLSQIPFGGKLALQGGASFSTTGNLDNAGTIDLAAGTIGVNGTYTQETTGTYDVGVSGTSAGSQYGQLNVTGQAAVSGTLSVSLTNGYMPTLGDSFSILTFGSKTGDFSAELGLSIGGGEAFTPTYEPGTSPTELDLVVSAAGLQTVGKYDGFGKFLQTTFESLDTIATTATATPLPGIGSALHDYLNSSPFLASAAQAVGAIDDTDVSTASVEAALLQAALGIPVTPVGDTFHLMLPGGTGTNPQTFPVNGFDAGLGVLGFTAQTPSPYNALASYSLDITVGTTGTTPADFFVEATRANNDPLDVTVTLPAANVPTLSGMFGPFYAKAVPPSSGNMLDLTYSMDLIQQTFAGGSSLAAIPVLNGNGAMNVGADLQFGLTLGFEALSSSSAPELTSGFELSWPFANSLAEQPLSQLGEAPTVSFTNVSLDFHTILNVQATQLLNKVVSEIQPIMTFAKVFAATNPELQKLGSEISGFLQGIGNSGLSASNSADPISTFLNLFPNLSLDNLIYHGAEIASQIDTSPDDADLYQYAEDFASAMEDINEVGELVNTIQNFQDVNVNIGRFSIGGSATDLRSP